MNGTDEALARAETLLERLEAVRAQLEASDDPERAIDILQELAEIARGIESELQQARRAAEADAADA